MMALFVSLLRTAFFHSFQQRNTLVVSCFSLRDNHHSQIYAIILHIQKKSFNITWNEVWLDYALKEAVKNILRNMCF